MAEKLVPLELIRTPLIKDLQKGLLEEAHFLLRRLVVNTGRSQKPFIRAILSDRTGHLPAVYFGPAAELKKLAETLKPGAIVRIQGVVEEFQGVTQLKLLKIAPSDKTDWDLSRFFKRTPHDRRVLYRELKALLSKVRNKELKELCFGFLKDRAFMKLFLESPASRFVHHAYIGGLLEHTLHVMQLCQSYARIYPMADFDLLMAGAFLHDLGKVDEYEFLLHAIDHSSVGRLKGHTLLGYDRLQQMLQRYPLAAPLRLKIEHIVLSHQGKRVWGAVEEPRFLEAYLVHAADSTDASQFIYAEARREIQGGDSRWSEVVSYLGREIFLG